MADEKKPDDEIEPWVTIQLTPPAPGGRFAAFITGEGIATRPIAFFALQHLAYEEDGADELDSRIVPVVLEPDGTALYLDRGEAGAGDHNFAGMGDTAADAELIGLAVLAELEKAAKASP